MHLETYQKYFRKNDVKGKILPSLDDSQQTWIGLSVGQSNFTISETQRYV